MDYEILLYGTILFVLVFLVPAFQRPRRTALWSVKLAQLDVRLQSAEKRENDDDRDAGYVDYAFSGVAADGQSVAGDARVRTADLSIDVTFAPGYVPPVPPRAPLEPIPAPSPTDFIAVPVTAPAPGEGGGEW